MAVHFATVADYLKRTTGIIQGSTTTQTRMCWAKSHAIPVVPAYQTFLVALDDPSTYVQYGGLFSGTPIDTNVVLDVGATARTAPVPTVDTWNHYCWVQSGTTHWFFLNGVQQGASITKNTAAFVFAAEWCGNDTLSDGNIDVAYVREWTVDLTAAQILAEMGASQAANLTSLFLDTPLTSDLLDISGNGRNWTQVGSGTFVAGPTLTTNNAIFTAQALTAPPPQSITLDMGQGTTAWYSYTPASVNEVVLGFWALYDYTKVSDLQLNVWQGPTSAPVQWPTTAVQVSGDSVPYQIPVTSGTTIYIQLSALNASVLPFTSTIAISTLPGPATDIAIGSIAVNDDLAGFPLAMMDNATGEVADFLHFTQSASGVVMPVTGQVLVDTGSAASGSTDFRLYESDYQTFVTIPYPTNTLPAGPFVIGTDGTSLFYVISDGASIRRHIITAYDLTGAVIATYDVGLFSIRAGSPNPDNTIFYYTTVTAGAVIKRWDLVNDVALADLAGTGIALYAAGPDLLVLGDGTIVAYYHRNGFADQIKHYDATGVTLNTYTMAASPIAVDHIATAIDDPNSFWAWLHNNDAQPFNSTFLNIKVSDGSFLVDTDAQIFEAGQYGGDFTVAPNARFGHSNSCPFWIVRVGITPPTPGPGEPEEFIIRRERWFPVINQENQRMTYSMLQVDLQAGNGLTTGQGSEPLLELDWSDDAGWTWSNIRFLPTGRIGQYNRRAIARVLGQSRQRVFRIAVSDPVQWVILDGYMAVKSGTS